MAESQGFEPWEVLPSQHFECCTFDRSDNSPKDGSSYGRPIYYKAYRTRLSSGNHICAARSTISIERRMNSVICSASSGWRESSARS